MDFGGQILIIKVKQLGNKEIRGVKRLIEYIYPIVFKHKSHVSEPSQIVEIYLTVNT